MSRIDDMALAQLKGCTQDQPMRLETLADKLGVELATMAMVATRLLDARAIATHERAAEGGPLDAVVGRK